MVTHSSTNLYKMNKKLKAENLWTYDWKTSPHFGQKSTSGGGMMLTSGASWEAGRQPAPSLTVEDKRLLEQSEEVSAGTTGIPPRALKLEDSKAEENPEGVSTSAKWRKFGSPRTKDIIDLENCDHDDIYVCKISKSGLTQPPSRARARHCTGQSYHHWSLAPPQ